MNKKLKLLLLSMSLTCFVGGMSSLKAKATETNDNGVTATGSMQTATLTPGSEGLTFTEGDFTFVGMSDGTAKIKKYKGNNKEITIPSEIQNYKVTAVLDKAFMDNLKLNKVTIPESITSIGKDAFAFCPYLSDISVNENNKNYCFSDGMLYTKDKTTLIKCVETKEGEVNVADGVKEIVKNAFCGCRKVTKLNIPASVILIDINAFNNFDGAEEININENNTKYSSIDGVLYNKNKTELIECPMAKKGVINIPDSTSEIPLIAFCGCENIICININENNANYSSLDGLLYNKNKTELIMCPQGKEGSIKIPDTVVSINDGALLTINKVKEIIVGDNNPKYSSLDGVLYNKDKTDIIKFPGGKEGTINIPDSVINLNSTSSWSSISAININDSNPNYSSIDGVLYNKNKTEILEVPNKIQGAINLSAGIITIKSFDFAYKPLLNAVKIQDGVKEIQDNSFMSCENLNAVMIPDSVTSIGDDAFNYCYGITIYGTQNSSAEEYAKKHSISFKLSSEYEKDVAIQQGESNQGEGQQTNPEQGQQTNPEQGQQTNPEQGQQTNPEQGQQTNPEQGQQTNPEQGQQTNPTQGEQTDPGQGQQTNPAQGEQTDPAQGQQTDPAQGEQASPEAGGIQEGHEGNPEAGQQQTIPENGNPQKEADAASIATVFTLLGGLFGSIGFKRKRK